MCTISPVTQRERGRRESRKFSVKSNLLLRGFFSKLKVYFQLSTHEQLFKGGQMIPLQKKFSEQKKTFSKECDTLSAPTSKI